MSKVTRFLAFENLKRAAWARTTTALEPTFAAHFNTPDARRDELGNIILFLEYGNEKSLFGWKLDCRSPGQENETQDPANIRAVAIHDMTKPKKLRGPASKSRKRAG